MWVPPCEVSGSAREWSSTHWVCLGQSPGVIVWGSHVVYPTAAPLSGWMFELVRAGMCLVLELCWLVTITGEGPSWSAAGRGWEDIDWQEAGEEEEEEGEATATTGKRDAAERTGEAEREAERQTREGNECWESKETESAGKGGIAKGERRLWLPSELLYNPAV